MNITVYYHLQMNNEQWTMNNTDDGDYLIFKQVNNIQSMWEELIKDASAQRLKERCST